MTHSHATFAKLGRPRPAILLWLTVWMLAVPLVHVHPEVDHHHGQSGHVHGGVFHTVFSSALPCEYESHSGAAVASTEASHEFEHPEVVFSLLFSLPDRSSGEPGFVRLGPVETGRTSVHHAGALAAELFLEPLPSVILSASLSSRAPPLSVA